MSLPDPNDPKSPPPANGMWKPPMPVGRLYPSGKLYFRGTASVPDEWANMPDATILLTEADNVNSKVSPPP